MTLSNMQVCVCLCSEAFHSHLLSCVAMHFLSVGSVYIHTHQDWLPCHSATNMLVIVYFENSSSHTVLNVKLTSVFHLLLN